MNNNIFAFPGPRKRGRRHLHPIPNVPGGRVLEFPLTSPTLEDRIAEYDACIRTAAEGLLIAIRAVRTLGDKYPIL